MRTLRTAAACGVTVVMLGTSVVGSAHAAPSGHGSAGRTSYTIVELGSFDGPAIGTGINNRGWVTGSTDVDGGEAVHATVWRRGVPRDLDTLGGPNSAVVFPVKNNRGLVVGIAETADVDPRDEAWSCTAFFPTEPDTDKVCRGFVWEDGTMRALPTHGGTHGFAAGANDRGLVVGWAETAETDDTCNQTNQFLGFRAAVWDTRNGDRIRELPPVSDDTASAATAINGRGQVVGISGDCANAVGGASAEHAVLWEHGRARKIDDLGGDAWNTPVAINDRGVVVGFANQPGTPGTAFNEEAFVWTKRNGVRPLGMLRGDDRSQALGVNDSGIVVGLSRRTGVGDTAVLWKHGKPIRLDRLAPDYDGELIQAGDINDAGVITGLAKNAAGAEVAFIAFPTGR